MTVPREWLPPLRECNERWRNDVGVGSLERFPAATDMCGRGLLTQSEGDGFPTARSRHGAAPAAPDFERKRWAIVDSNHGPPPYQSGRLGLGKRLCDRWGQWSRQPGL